MVMDEIHLYGIVSSFKKRVLERETTARTQFHLTNRIFIPSMPP